MKPAIYKILAVSLCICLLIFPVSAEEAATDITQSTTITASGYGSVSFLTDGDIDTYKSSGGDVTITLENTAGMAGIYLLFDLEYGAYTITDNETGKSATAGTYGMLHEYIDLVAVFGTMPKSVTLDFDNGPVCLSELSVYAQGALPDSVQVWNAPYEGGADMVLFATHGDDDQLFFAGLLPLYAAEKGFRVQVVYLTDHRNLTRARTHEMLNGLWNVGVTAYPVFGSFADFRIDSLQGTYDEYASLGTSKEELQSFVVEQIRRFKPLVAVGHDINGEYGHGMHMVYADLLIRSLSMTGDAAVFSGSAEKYGTWEIPKLYLHLYEENAVVIDYDQPLESFGGMTAFEVTQKRGYPCHRSQQWTWFTRWIRGKNGEITKASQIETYNPCKFGLYYSSVGEDVEKNDFFENIITYAEREQLEHERQELERLEQERLEREQLEAKLEQERQEKERLEQEQLEAQQQEAEKQAAAARREKRITILVVSVVLIVLLIGVLLAVKAGKRRRKK